MIFNKRWYGIEVHAFSNMNHEQAVLRVQTKKDGPWQSLTADEIQQLMQMHNKAIKPTPRFNLANQVKVLGATSELERLLAESKANVDAMTPEQREEMLRQQRDGWVKAELQWAKDFREGKCERD